MTTYEKAVKLFKVRPELIDVAFHEVNFYSESDLVEHFDDMLDSYHQSVNLCGYTYSVSQTLKAVDSIAYHQELLTYIDALDVVEIDGRYYYEAELADFVDKHSDTVAM